MESNLIQECPKLDYLQPDALLADYIRASRKVVRMYGECRLKDKKLIQAIAPEK